MGGRAGGLQSWANTVDRTARTAPASGLFLVRVDYRAEAGGLRLSGNTL